jgi:replication-associated recombination protein RarA
MSTAIKYAPRELTDVIYPNHAVHVRITAYARGEMDGHLILWGPNGTGKTTVANLLPYAISGDSAWIESEDFDELLSKKDLKSYLLNSCAVSRMSTSKKYFIVFHEFDNAKANVSKFWTALDKCGEDVMAIITTNEPMQIHQSIRSRFDNIEFPKLKATQVLMRAQEILIAEGVTLPDQDVLHYLKQIENFGDLRKYFKKLDEIIFIVKNNMLLPVVPNSNSRKPSLSLVDNKFSVLI